jgi:hypothetical protein
VSSLPNINTESNIEKAKRWGKDVVTLITAADAAINIIDFLMKIHAHLPRSGGSGSFLSEFEERFQDPWGTIPKVLVPGARLQHLDKLEKLYNVCTDLIERPDLSSWDTDLISKMQSYVDDTLTLWLDRQDKFFITLLYEKMEADDV